MKKPLVVIKWLSLIAIASAMILSGCRPQPTPTPQVYSRPELAYRLMARFTDLFWCDPYLWPIGRPEQERQDALEQFPAIRADAEEFSAIREHLDLAEKLVYSDEEKLAVFREHNRLTRALEMVASGDDYRFALRVGRSQGERLEGTITSSGAITITKREPSFNTCPICLVQGTLIDTPKGPVPVERLRPGMDVWTVAATGERVLASIVKTTLTPVPSSFRVARVTLSDGRTVTASPGHPTAAGRALGDFKAGDGLDGATVTTVELLDYDGEATYDILPGGGSGLYWANGVLLKSTLAGD